MDSIETDIVILGGGPAGLTLAVALDAHGIRSAVIDPMAPEAMLSATFDGRASAIASAPWRMLQAIGVASRLEGQGCPIAKIQVSDGLSRGLAFDPAEEEGAVGIMFENRLLRVALREAALAAKGVTLLMPARPASVERNAARARVTLEDGRVVQARLVVGAEGRRSPMREAARIRVAEWRYDHKAIISSVFHEAPHEGVAHEIFYPAGPFAILPLVDDAEGRHRSALVWTVAERHGAAMLELPDRAFAAEAEKKMGGRLGAIAMASPRFSYPLGFHHAAHITAERLALVGDAAHGIHPIAGQGLNLGFRDTAALVEVLVDGARLGLDFGDAQLLARYERWRALDTLLVASTTDALTRLFGIKGRGAAAVRRFGLGAVERIAPLKRRFMAEARGETGTLPKLLVGERV